ncbi:sigma-70 family RNA polymerase sigma factor [Ruminococcaceae bacterium OttesenSCG-928-D13]|nr:sigma-70 family RNA polymerase sigma factor [Ruminococcaceae bacterium OttesenSCG-928-D13]
MDKKQMAGLVEKAKKGDKAAFESLYKECANTVYFAALKILHNETAAQDVTQDTFVAAYENIGKLKNGAAFGAWVYRISANLAEKARTRTKEVLSPEDTPPDIADMSKNPEKLADKQSTSAIIGGLLDKLPSEQRAAMVLFYFSELSVKDIAQASGATVENVKVRLHRGRNAIKEGVKAFEKAEGIKLHSVGGAAITAALAAEAAGIAAPSFMAGTTASVTATSAATSAAGVSTGAGAGAVVGIVGGAVAVVGGGVVAATVLLAAPEITLENISIARPEAVMLVGESISPDYSAQIIVDGETYTLDYTAEGMTASAELDEKALEQVDAFTAEWTSANPSVASVENGIITAQANGETSITLTMTHGEENRTASIDVLVETRVASISLPDTLNLNRGDTVSLTATVEPSTASNPGVVYESADPEIASVDAAGTVTGVGPGQVQIKATSAENPAIYALCMVTVDVIPESIELSQTEALLYVGRNFTLEPTIGPEDVTVECTLVWESDDESVATVDENGVVRGVSPGTATVTVKLAEYDEILATCTVTVQRAPAAPTTPSGGGTGTGGTGDPAPSGGDGGSAPAPSAGGDVAAAIAAGYARAFELGAIQGTGGGSYNAPISTAISTEAMTAAVLSEVEFQMARGGAGCAITIYESGGYIYVRMQ